VRLIEELRTEHDLIEQMLGSLLTYVDQRIQGAGDPPDGARFVGFFRRYVGFHHEREEHTLFPALVSKAEVPGDRGPIAALTAQHERLAILLDGLERHLAMPLGDEATRQQLSSLAKEYAHSLWRHIDAENSVLFPEGEARLRKHGVAELESRFMTREESEARKAAEELLRRYPPKADREIIRGDGCVMCPAFAESCGGLEQEWWNEWEWEEFHDHLTSG
jgi:hemerythrin-like domain-containing protein